MSDRDPKSLCLWIIESIDEELAQRTGLTGEEIYLRGVERCEEAAAIRSMAAQRRALQREVPLFAKKGDGDG